MARMACPECGDEHSDVTDSRPNHMGIWRRRICPNGHRYSTQEVTDAQMQKVADMVTVRHRVRDAIAILREIMK